MVLELRFNQSGRDLILTGPDDRTLAISPSIASLRVGLAPTARANLALDLKVFDHAVLDSGSVRTFDDVFRVEPGCTFTRTGGHIWGNLEKPIDLSTTSVTFELGDPAGIRR